MGQICSPCQQGFHAGGGESLRVAHPLVLFAHADHLAEVLLDG